MTEVQESFAHSVRVSWIQRYFPGSQKDALDPGSEAWDR